MTYQMDRTDWRARADKELIEAARDSGHELAIALGERLEALEGTPTELYEAEAQIADLTRQVKSLRAELNALYDTPGAE